MRLGIGIVISPRVVKTAVPEKFGGTAFTWKLLEAAAQRGLSLYLVGSPAGGMIETTATVIAKRLPKLRVVGQWPGRLRGLEGGELLTTLRQRPVESELVADLLVKKPDIILVGMGFPLQEELMAKVAPQLAHGVLIGEGGTFDYDSFGGRRRKAPKPVQTVGLEWLWRLVLEPRRWRRQLALPRFVWAVYCSGQNTKA